MAFETDEQRKAVMAILTAMRRPAVRKGKRVLYHASFDPDLDTKKLSVYVPLHAGSKESAKTRARQKYPGHKWDLQKQPRKNKHMSDDAYLYELEIDVNKPLLSTVGRLHIGRDRFTDRAYEGASKQAVEAIQRLRDRGMKPSDIAYMLDQQSLLAAMRQNLGRTSTRRPFSEYLLEEGDRLDNLFAQIPSAITPADYYTRNRKLLKRLRDRGYDVIPYINRVEDPNQLSFGIIQPEKIKFRGKRKMKKTQSGSVVFFK